MTTKRSKGREIALQFLFQNELKEGGEGFDEEYDFFLRNLRSDNESNGFDDSSVKFAKIILLGVFKNKKVIDKEIALLAKNWDFNRISLVDKCILRIAGFEILFAIDIPAKVAVNEAIELAKKFGSKDSGSFVNGILDKLLKSKKIVD